MKSDDLSAFRERTEGVLMRRRISLSKNTFLRHLTTLDTGSVLVIIITFMLFTVSIFVKGVTHDILLESGVFLVSVKLIIMSYKSNIMDEAMHVKLNDIYDTLIKDSEYNNKDGGGVIDKGNEQV